MFKYLCTLILISSISSSALGECTSEILSIFKANYQDYKTQCSKTSDDNAWYAHTCLPVKYTTSSHEEGDDVLSCEIECKSNNTLPNPDGTVYWLITFIRGEVFVPKCLDPEKFEEAKSNNNYSPQLQCGSIIQTTNQVVGENIPLIGSSFSLRYFSNRVQGRIQDYQYKRKLTGDNPDPLISNYKIQIYDENGVLLDVQDFVGANQTYNYTWNGKIGNDETWGSIRRILKESKYYSDIDYNHIYTSPDIYVGSFKSKKLGLGGWVPSSWHFYDVASSQLYLGDGNIRAVEVVEDGVFKRAASEDGSEVYYFDSLGRIAYTKSGLTGAVLASFAYDLEGRLSAITEPFNKVTTFKRYLNGKLKAIIAPHNKKTVAVVNSQGYLTKTTSPNNESYEMTYNGAAGLLLSFKKPNGSISTMAYNSDGNLISDNHSSGYGISLNKTINGVVSTSSLGRQKVNKYDSNLKSEYQTSASGLIEMFTNTKELSAYDSPFNNFEMSYVNDPRFGEQVKFVSEKNLVNFGTTSIANSRSAILNNANDPYSIAALTDVSISGNSEITSLYDGITKTKTITTKLGRTFLTQIDEYERPVKIQNGDLIARNFTYTEGNLSKITQGTRKTVFSYYGNDLLKSVRNDLGQVTTYTYDNAQRLKTATLPDLRVINYSYDSEGNLTSISPPNRPAHQLIFGSNEKLSSYKPPATNNGTVNTITNYSYNLDRQLTQISRPDGQNINFNYDLITGLLSNVTSNFGNVVYTYSHERPKTISYNGLFFDLDYIGDTVSSIELKDNSMNTLYFYERSPDSTQGERVGSETINGGSLSSVAKTINYSYDDDGYLTKVGDLELQFNSPNGQLEQTKLSNIRDYYYYNSFGEIRAYKAKFQNTEIYSYNLVRDGIGRITQKVETLNNVTSTFDYVYDSAGRLTQVSTNGVVTSTYGYDYNSNRISANVRGENATATYNVQDRILTYGSQTFSANLNGDITRKMPTVGATAETIEQLIYDPFGNLTSYKFFDWSVDYEVDPFLRRLGRKIDGEVKQRYVYSPEGRIVGELESSNRLVKTFVYGSKSHVPDYYIDESGNKFRIITDHLGSVRLLVAATSGRVIKLMEHDEFGRVLQDTRPGFLPFGFAGGIYEQYTGLVRFGARDYDPEVGRWLSKDPILFNGGDTNLYGYVINDPVNFIDPDGLVKKDPAADTGGAAGTGGGGTIYVSGNGTAVQAQPGATVGTVRTGNGLLIQNPGSNHPNGNQIRMMDEGYIRVTDPYGRYLDPRGNIVPKNDPSGHMCE